MAHTALTPAARANSNASRPRSTVACADGPDPQGDDNVRVRSRSSSQVSAVAAWQGQARRRPRAQRLSPRLEHELLDAAQSGDPIARAKLVETFVPLIGSVARIYRSSRAVERTELIQEGVVGLLRALERYDLTKGTPFWAYASWWVRQAMQQLVAELTRPVVLSDRALRQLARVKDARRVHLQAACHEPSVSELASETGFGREQVENLLAVERTPRALEEPIGDGENSDGVFGELLADPLAEDAYERVDRRLELEALRELPGELCEREQVILRARFGLDGRRQTLREVAGSLDLSAERVRQIEERALERLRDSAMLPAA
jgi:RNA polymerase primary sigma factor